MTALKRGPLSLYILVILSSFLFETVALPVHVIEHSLDRIEQLSQNRQKDSARPTKMEASCEFCLALHSSSTLQPIHYEFASPQFETLTPPVLARISIQKVELLQASARGPPTF